jgi:hypothetical protein
MNRKGGTAEILAIVPANRRSELGDEFAFAHVFSAIGYFDHTPVVAPDGGPADGLLQAGRPGSDRWRWSVAR